jgi:hypothetical protein
MNNWKEVTVEQFINLTKLIPENYSTDELFYIDALSILDDYSNEEIEQMDYQTFQTLISELSFLKTTPVKKPAPIIFVNSKKLKLIDDFNYLSVGEFIDLEHFFSNDYYLNLTNILAIVYRIYNEHQDKEWFPDQIEPYGNYIFHRAPYFNSISINNVYGVIAKYIDWRNQLFETYDGLFDGVSDDDDNDEFLNDNESIVSKSERIKEQKKQQAIKKWGWDIFLLRLANNDITKVEAVTKINLIQALNTLSCKKELNID